MVSILLIAVPEGVDEGMVVVMWLGQKFDSVLTKSSLVTIEIFRLLGEPLLLL